MAAAGLLIRRFNIKKDEGCQLSPADAGADLDKRMQRTEVAGSTLISSICGQLKLLLAS